MITAALSLISFGIGILFTLILSALYVASQTERHMATLWKNKQ